MGEYQALHPRQLEPRWQAHALLHAGHFLTAIIVSLATVRSNTAVMVGWALVISALLFAAMLAAFLGLLVALPVLGHATWHLYRRAVSG